MPGTSTNKEIQKKAISYLKPAAKPSPNGTVQTEKANGSTAEWEWEHFGFKCSSNNGSTSIAASPLTIAHPEANYESLLRRLDTQCLHPRSARHRALLVSQELLAQTYFVKSNFGETSFPTEGDHPKLATFEPLQAVALKQHRSKSKSGHHAIESFQISALAIEIENLSTRGSCRTGAGTGI